jgi:hypothetical protein
VVFQGFKGVDQTQYRTGTHRVHLAENINILREDIILTRNVGNYSVNNDNK